MGGVHHILQGENGEEGDRSINVHGVQSRTTCGWPSKRGWKMVNVSWHSSTICTWCRPQSEQLLCTIFCEKSCGSIPRSVCTTARRASGIVVVLSRTNATCWKKQQRPCTRTNVLVPGSMGGGRVRRTNARGRGGRTFPLPRQLAMDTTLVCLLTREGEAKPRTATTSGSTSLPCLVLRGPARFRPHRPFAGAVLRLYS